MVRSMDSTGPSVRRAVLSLCAIVGVACATAPAKPADLREHFLTGRDAQFPPDRYLVGVGRGSDLGQARATALADIGAQIQSKIEGTLVSHEEIIVGPGRNASASQVTNDVRQHTTFDYQGHAIVLDTQAKDGAVYVLVVLDRAVAADSFRREVSKTRTLLRHALDDFAAAEAKMDLRGAARLAKEVAARARELAPSLVLVESIAGAIPTDGEWAEVARAAQVDAEVARMRSRTSIEFCLTPAPDFPEAGQLIEALIDHVVSLGASAIRCGQARGSATLRAEGKISAVFSTEAALGSAVFCRPSVDFRLLDVKDGTEIMSASLGGDPARAAVRDREVATRAALKKLAAVCAPKLSEALGEPPRGLSQAQVSK